MSDRAQPEAQESSTSDGKKGTEDGKTEAAAPAVADPVADSGADSGDGEAASSGDEQPGAQELIGLDGQPDGEDTGEETMDTGSSGSPEETGPPEEHQDTASHQGGGQHAAEPSDKVAKTTRRAHLTLSRIEPWSVMKFSFIISLVCFIILFVATTVIYAILASLGVFDALTELITSLTDGGEPDDELPLNPETWFSAWRVLSYTFLIGALNVILITALSTVGAMLYNLTADIGGGLDITLSEANK